MIRTIFFFTILGLFLPCLLMASQPTMQFDLPLLNGQSSIDFSQAIQNQKASPGSFVKLASKVMDPNRMSPQMTAYGLNLIKSFVRMPESPQKQKQTQKVTTKINDKPFVKEPIKKITLIQEQERPIINENVQNKKEIVCQNTKISPERNDKKSSKTVQKPIEQPLIQKCQQNKQGQIECQQKLQNTDEHFKPNSQPIKKNHKIKQEQILQTKPDIVAQPKKEQITVKKTSNLRKENKENEGNNNNSQNVNEKIIQTQKLQQKQPVISKNPQQPVIIEKQIQPQQQVITLPINQPINIPPPSRFHSTPQYKDQFLPVMPNFDFQLPKYSAQNQGWRKYDGQNMINGEGNYIKGEANQIKGHGNVVICP